MAASMLLDRTACQCEAMPFGLLQCLGWAAFSSCRLVMCGAFAAMLEQGSIPYWDNFHGGHNEVQLLRECWCGRIAEEPL